MDPIGPIDGPVSTPVQGGGSMTRRIAMLAVAAALFGWSGAAQADNNVGCGWGTQVWEGNSGFLVQMLATTARSISR